MNLFHPKNREFGAQRSANSFNAFSILSPELPRRPADCFCLQPKTALPHLFEVYISEFQYSDGSMTLGFMVNCSGSVPSKCLETLPEVGQVSTDDPNRRSSTEPKSHRTRANLTLELPDVLKQQEFRVDLPRRRGSAAVRHRGLAPAIPGDATNPGHARNVTPFDPAGNPG